MGFACFLAFVVTLAACGGDDDVASGSIDGVWQGTINGNVFRSELDRAGVSRGDNLTVGCGGVFQVLDSSETRMVTRIQLDTGPACIEGMLNTFELVDEATLTSNFYSPAADIDSATLLFSGPMYRQ